MTYRRPLITIATADDLDRLERSAAEFQRRNPAARAYAQQIEALEEENDGEWDYETEMMTSGWE